MNIQDGTKREASEPLIFDIQHFSVGDGPGIRTTVFFKGCNLHCPWCHNPESIDSRTQLMYEASRCTDCGVCSSVCTSGAQRMKEGRHIFQRDQCRMCGLCVEHCPHTALRMAGRRVTVDALIDEILEDTAFYRSSGGGVTLSGGEPLMQADACLALLREIKQQNLHTLLDSALTVPLLPDKLLEIAGVTDCVYADIKSASVEYYRQVIGGELETVLRQIELLRDTGVRVVLRLPMIPGVNTSKEQLTALVQLLKPLNLPVCPLAFHRMGTSKYQALGIPYAFGGKEPMKTEELLEIKQYFQFCGLVLTDE